MAAISAHRTGCGAGALELGEASTTLWVAVPSTEEVPRAHQRLCVTIGAPATAPTCVEVVVAGSPTGDPPPLTTSVVDGPAGIEGSPPVVPGQSFDLIVSWSGEGIGGVRGDLASWEERTDETWSWTYDLLAGPGGAARTRPGAEPHDPTRVVEQVGFGMGPMHLVAPADVAVGTTARICVEVNGDDGAVRPCLVVAVVASRPGPEPPVVTGPATWRVDPEAPPVPADTTVQVLVTAVGCGGGGQVVGGVVAVGDGQVVVTVAVELSPDGGCPVGDGEVAATVDLGALLGERSLVDGTCGQPAGAAVEACADGGTRGPAG